MLAFESSLEILQKQIEDMYKLSNYIKKRIIYTEFQEDI